MISFTKYSSVVIEQMRERHKETRPTMDWHEMDVRDLKFGDSTFDVAIDKGLCITFIYAPGTFP